MPGLLVPPSGFTHSDGRPSEGQAEQHQQRDNLMVGVDVRQAQAPVVAVKTGLYRLEDVCPLQEVEADHGRDQDGQLLTGRGGVGVRRRAHKTTAYRDSQ